eukprot:CAMPEP_0170458530 /NCGR_PEP_ID=MMETSP0123-20130129/5471_1 /TAXON_ID=182087 /ORGANISM="Favella ehrenbergii, Strain Fehren 1" /LENGTH=36 /DNA_ID= /DNA_START= /DNA_END= /DNA_ORIENTATION=
MKAPFKPPGNAYKIDKRQLKNDFNPGSNQVESVMSR